MKAPQSILGSGDRWHNARGEHELAQGLYKQLGVLLILNANLEEVTKNHPQRKYQLSTHCPKLSRRSATLSFPPILLYCATGRKQGIPNYSKAKTAVEDLVKTGQQSNIAVFRTVVVRDDFVVESIFGTRICGNLNLDHS